jgi:hypothetical protein
MGPSRTWRIGLRLDFRRICEVSASSAIETVPRAPSIAVKCGESSDAAMRASETRVSRLVNDNTRQQHQRATFVQVGLYCYLC